MSSEVQKYIKERLEKNENLFNAEVINFPNEKKVNVIENSEIKKPNFWKISDKSNHDQLKAVTGVCFMFGVLIIMGLYSNLIN